MPGNDWRRLTPPPLGGWVPELSISVVIPYFEAEEELRRTLALVGPSAAGKTSLVEALLCKAGTLKTPGSVERGSTVSDYDPLEKSALRSLNTALVHFEHRGIRTHLIDTPGAPDFLGQSLPALEAVETAAVVINATAGVEPPSRPASWATAA